LLGQVPYEAACFAGQLRTVLAEPEMMALLDASPPARRVQRPLRRVLGIEASGLAPGGVTRPELGSTVQAGPAALVAVAAQDGDCHASPWEDAPLGERDPGGRISRTRESPPFG
jgi:hypothetical protein